MFGGRIDIGAVEGRPDSFVVSTLGDGRRARQIADADNRVYLVFSDYQRGGGVTVAYSEDAGRKDWQFIDLTTEDMGRWDPTYDLNRCRNDGILSMFYLP